MSVDTFVDALASYRPTANVVVNTISEIHRKGVRRSWERLILVSYQEAQAAGD